MYDWSQMFIKEGENMSQTVQVREQSKQLIEQVGFVNVLRRNTNCPLGTG
jgi:hypothetical protein